MPISKNIPMALNKSSDERLLKPNEMTDAKNVTVSTDAEGNGFVLKNARGNTQIPPKDASADVIFQNQSENKFKVLGSCVDEEANTLYFAVYDLSGAVPGTPSHGIYRIDFNQSTLAYEEILVNRNLFGLEPEFVDMDVIRVDVNQAGDIVPIIYMTDNKSEPKKINVDRAITNAYAVDADIKEFLSVAKTKPVYTFDVKGRKDNNFKGNFIYGKSLSFAIQWVYQDGERSALSNISDCVIPQVVITSEEDGSRKDEINYYEVNIDKGTTEVKEINVYYRDNETGLMFLADRLNRNSDLVRVVGTTSTTIYDQSEAIYNFYGDRDQEPAPLIETNKLYDNVPLKAQTQCIADGRLMYGNYTEGRDLPNIKAEFEVTYDDPYNDNFNQITATRSFEEVTGFIRSAETQCQSKAVLNFAQLPDTIKAGSTAAINLTFFASNDTTSTAFVTTTNSADWAVRFNYQGTTWNLGRPSPSNSFYPLLLPELQDIRIENARHTGVEKSRSDFLDDIVSNLNSASVVVKYNRPPTTTSTSSAISVDNASILQNVRLKKADLTFGIDAVKSGDTIECSLILESASNMEIVVTSSENTVTNPQFNGALADEDVLVGLIAADAEKAHDIRNKSSFIDGTSSSFKSFKRGANHTFGMILYDERGRSSFVKELGSAYVETKGEQGGDSNGRAKIKVKFPQVSGSNQSLPTWVDKYQIVYGGSDIEEFKQYTVSGGFANYWSYSDFDSSDAKEDASKNIYISLKGWSGSRSSYTGENGANHTYNPKEGDILRIVRYDLSNTVGEESRFYPDDLEFYVVGKTTLRKDVVTDDINLIRAEQEFEKDRDEAKARRRERRAERRRKKGKDGPGLLTKLSDLGSNVIEKIGDNEDLPFLDRLITTRDEKLQDLDDAEEDARNKIKETPISARNPVFPGGQVTFDANGVSNNDAEDFPMAKGEFLIIKDPETSSWGREDAVQVKFNSAGEIEEVSDVSDGVNKHWFAILNWAKNVVVEVYTPAKSKSERIYIETPDVHTYSSSLPVAGHDIDTGDVWLKRIPVKYNKKENNSTNRGVDHYFRYWAMDDMFFKNTYLESTHGSHYFPSDARVFGRSHFVNKYASENKRRHSITYSDKYSSDSPFLNLSNFNLSRSNFVDLDSSYGGVDRLFSNDGFLSCIQQAKVSRLPLGSVSVQLGTTTDTLTSAETIIGKPTYYAGTYGTRGKTQMSIMRDGNIFFTDLTAKKVMNVNASGISAISDAGMDNFFQDKIEQWDALATKSRVFMGYDPDYSEVLLAMNSSGADFEGFVAAYNVGMKRWTSLYDFSDDGGFEPTLFANIGNRFISCLYTSVGDSGSNEFIFFEHKDGITKANYYGDQKTYTLEIVVNEFPSMVKIFESLSLETNYGDWIAEITTSDQSADIPTGFNPGEELHSWEERERGYYVMIPRDKSSNSTSHKIAIPSPVKTSSTIGDSDIEFTDKVNRVAIPYGAKLYNETQDATIQNASSEDVLVSFVNGENVNIQNGVLGSNAIQAGDVISVLLDQSVYGDAIRDYFCKVKLTSDANNTADIELFAINTHYDRSKLGQEKQ